MFHQDQTGLFGTVDTSKPHRIAVFIASLPILNTTLPGIQLWQLRQNREHPDSLLCPTTLPNRLDIHRTRSIL